MDLNSSKERLSLEVSRFSPNFYHILTVIAVALVALEASFSDLQFPNLGPSYYFFIFIKLAIVTVIFFTAMCLFRSSPKLKRQDWKRIISFGIIGISSVFAYRFLSSVEDQVMLGTFIKYLVIFGVLMVGKEYFDLDISPKLLSAILCLTAGTYFVLNVYNLDSRDISNVGVLAGLGSMISLGVWTVHTQKLTQHYPPLTILFYGFLIATLLCSILFPFIDMTRVTIPMESIVEIVLHAAIGVAIPFFIMTIVIKKIGATEFCVVAGVESLIVAIIHWTTKAQPFDAVQWFGAALVCGAVILLQVRKEARPSKPLNFEPNESKWRIGGEIFSGDSFVEHPLRTLPAIGPIEAEEEDESTLFPAPTPEPIQAEPEPDPIEDFEPVEPEPEEPNRGYETVPSDQQLAVVEETPEPEPEPEPEPPKPEPEGLYEAHEMKEEPKPEDEGFLDMLIMGLEDGDDGPKRAYVIHRRDKPPEEESEQEDEKIKKKDEKILSQMDMDDEDTQWERLKADPEKFEVKLELPEYPNISSQDDDEEKKG